MTTKIFQANAFENVLYKMAAIVFIRLQTINYEYNETLQVTKDNCIVVCNG